MFYVYVIRSKKDDKWYTGSTADLWKRFREHNDKRVLSTKGRGPFELIYYEACMNEHDAIAREKYLKSGMGKRYIRNRLKHFLSLTGFTPLEIATDFSRWSSLREANGGIPPKADPCPTDGRRAPRAEKPPLAQTVRERSSLTGFTLLELLISIAIASIISVVIYFSLETALNVWGYSRDQLALQKILGEVIDEVGSGTAAVFGLKDALEIDSAGMNSIEFVPPWRDDTHRVTSAQNFVYTLNRKIKPGSALPIGEIKFPGEDEYRYSSVIAVESEEETVFSKVRLGLAAPAGSQLRFTYHPDGKSNPDVMKSIRWDKEEGAVYAEYLGEIDKISRNPFGVKITNMEFHYYDNTNTLIADSDWAERGDLNRITGIEVSIEARLGQYVSNLLSFINLRNAPLRSGYFLLSEEGTRIPVADSQNIHSLVLQNFSGVNNGDVLELEATPESGKSWNIKITFGRVGSSKPFIENYTIEYPEGHPIHTEYPRSTVDMGLNLLTLGSNGLYDYDDDDDIEDMVVLEGEVVLEVKKIDIEGVGLFVRP